MRNAQCAMRNDHPTFKTFKTFKTFETFRP